MSMDTYIRDEKSDKLRNLQLAQIELIRTLVKICEKEGLIYYMLGGTMLGAVRHKGYIPWDDDADFGMPRGDYEKFLVTAPKYLSQEVSLSTFNGVDHFYYMAKLVHKKRKVKIDGVLEPYVSYTWIDIFPLDGMPENSVCRALHKARLLAVRELSALSNFEKIHSLNNVRKSWFNRAATFICRYIPIYRLVSKQKAWKLLDTALKAYPYEKSSWNLNLMGAYKFRELFPQSVFGEGDFYDFEGMQLRGPKDYVTYLTQLYGDYMTPPPESERGSKHNVELLEEEK